MNDRSSAASSVTRLFGALLGVAIAPALLAEPVPGIDIASDQVGATPAEFNVDASGAASYSVPIFTVPAPGGVAPQLALSYSSRGGQGALGVGWGISGTSSIERCRKTTEHGDGAGPFPAVNFSSTDVFCLDGQRLIQVSASPSATCPTISGLTAFAEFRTEIESFARVCAYQGDGISNGPSRFTVERRDGSTAQYAFTADSRVEPNNLGAARTDVVMRWALNRTRQPTGAYIDYVYEEFPATGEHRLTDVKFTGRDTAPTQSTTAYVKFNYETMPAHGLRVDYVAGSKVSLAKRLAKIESFANTSTIVRKYELCYEDAASCFSTTNPAYSATATQRLPRVTALQECANAAWGVLSTAACRVPTRFEWNLPTLGYSAPSQSFGDVVNLASPTSPTKYGDFNGDGSVDQVRFESHCANDSTQFLAPNGSTLVEGAVEFGSATAYASTAPTGVAAPATLQIEFVNINGHCREQSVTGKFHVYDFNADGLDDLLLDDASPGMAIFIASINGNSVSFARFDASLDPSLDSPKVKGTALTDVDGDGLPDLLIEVPVGLASTLKLQRMVKSGTSGYRFADPIPLKYQDSAGNPFTVTTAMMTNANRKPLQATDINADGRADFLVYIDFDPLKDANNQLPTARFKLVRSEGIQMVDGVQSLLVTVEIDDLGDPTNISFADMNADGLPEILHSVTSATNTTLRWRINTGRMAPDRFLAYSAALATPGPAPGEVLRDVNSDGYPDLVYHTACVAPCSREVRVRLGSADLFQTASSSYLLGSVPREVDSGTMCGNLPCESELLMHVDLNADGTPEMLRRSVDFGTSLVKVRRYGAIGRTYDADTIKAVTNGMLARTEVVYAPLTQSSVYKRHSGASVLSYGTGSPAFDTFSPMAVVKAVKRSMPIATDLNNLHETRYLYRGARVQAGGRGFLGFERRTEIDVASKIATTTQFRQDFPFIGEAKASYVELLGSLPSDACSSSPDTAGCLTYSTGTDAASLAALSLGGTRLRTGQNVHGQLQSGSIRFPYLSASAEITYALNGSTVLSKVEETWSYTSDAVAACKTGSCGNLAFHDKSWKQCDGGVECLDVYESTTHNYATASTTGFGNFTTAGSVPRWQLGLIGATTVQRERLRDVADGQGGATRTEHFGYDAYGLLTQTVTEPGGDNTLFLRTMLTRDGWGNVTQTVRCSKHFTAANCSSRTGFVQRQWSTDPTMLMRYATNSYSADGRFVASESVPYYDNNVAGAGELHASFTIADSDRNALGQPKQRTDASGVISSFVNGAFGQEQFRGDNSGGFQYTKVRPCNASICPTGAAYRVDSNSQVGGDFSNGNIALAPTNLSFHDKLGREIARSTRLIATNPSGKQWSSVRTEYDSRGRAYRVSVPYFSDAAAAIQSTNGTCNGLGADCWEVKLFDAIDRTSEITKPDLVGTSKTYMTYDTTARQVTQQTQQSTSVWITHKSFNNSLGEAVKVTESNGKDSTLKYAAFGELAEITKTEQLAGQTTNSTVTLSAMFDARGRKTSSVDPDKGTTFHQYNALGELVWSKDAKDTEQTRYYDALGRMYYKANHYRVGSSAFSDEVEHYNFDYIPVATNATSGSTGANTPEIVANGEFVASLASWISSNATWKSNSGNNNSSSVEIANGGLISQTFAIDPAQQYDFAFWRVVPNSPSEFSRSAKAELLVDHLGAGGKVEQTDVFSFVNGAAVGTTPVFSSTILTPHPAATSLKLRFSVSGMTGLKLLVDSVSLKATSPYARDPMSVWTTTGTFKYGKLVSSEDDAVTYRRNFAYDSLGRPIGESWKYVGATSDWTVAATEYDAYGRVSKRFDPDRQTYNAAATTHGLGDGVEYSYAATGHVATETNIRGGSRLRSLVLQDARGQIANETFASGGGLSVTRVFDERTGLQLTQQAYASAAKVQDFQYSYDKLGNVSERQNNVGGQREVFAYDTLNRLTKVQQAGTAPVTALADTLALTYDAFGNIATKTTGGSTLTYGYCGSNCAVQPHGVKSALGAQPTPVLPADAQLGMSAVAYDNVGQVSSTLTHALGTRLSGATTVEIIKRQSRNLYYTWSGRLASAETYDSRRDRSATAGTLFEPDPNGLATLQLFNYGPGGEMVYRLSSVRTLDGAANYVLPQAKDAGGNGNGNGRNGVHQDHGRHLALAYGHDPEFLAALNEMDATDIRRPLKYPALRRLPKDKNNPRLLGKATCDSTAYPAEVPMNDHIAYIFGNTEFLLTRDECSNSRRRNLGYVIIEQRQNRATNNYSPFDWSNGSTSPKTTVVYTYQLTDPLGSIDVQVRMTDNLTFAASTAQANRNPRRVSFDAHGQQRHAVAVDSNGDGDTIDPGDFGVWAAMTDKDRRLTRVEGTSRGYAGHENYNAVGIVHMKGRIYDPTLGRFLQPDPIVEDDLNPQTWNRYTYVRNNPMTFTDPTGFATAARDGCGTRCEATENRQRENWKSTGGNVMGNSTRVTVSEAASPAGTTKGAITSSSVPGSSGRSSSTQTVGVNADKFGRKPKVVVTDKNLEQVVDVGYLKGAPGQSKDDFVQSDLGPELRKYTDETGFEACAVICRNLIQIGDSFVNQYEASIVSWGAYMHCSSSVASCGELPREQEDAHSHPISGKGVKLATLGDQILSDRRIMRGEILTSGNANIPSKQDFDNAGPKGSYLIGDGMVFKYAKGQEVQVVGPLGE